MKAIMYHYIRNFSREFPNYNFLEKKKFLNQVDFFSREKIISTNNEIRSNREGNILTFDDGLKDHIWAAEELKKRKLTGIFFVSTQPYEKKEILDVHKSHIVLGKVGANDALKELKKIIIQEKYLNFFNSKIRKKFKYVYKDNKDETSANEFKKIVNYFSNSKMNSIIFKKLTKKFDIKLDYRKYYLSPKEIKYLSELGMVIGSHSKNHIPLSRLTLFQQTKEIRSSKKFLENVIKKKCNIFCYPYGGKINYNNNTLKVLRKLKFKFAFSTGNKKITKNDLIKRPFELPRFDCNRF